MLNPGDDNNQGNGWTANAEQQERQRRSQIMRLGILLCLIFLLLDGGVNSPASESGGSPGASRTAGNSVVALEEIRLPFLHANRINNILWSQQLEAAKARGGNGTAGSESNTDSDKKDDLRSKSQFPDAQLLSRSRFNVTGLYRGLWSNKIVESASGRNVTESGNMLLQLKSIAIRDVPDLVFVYGVVRLYGSRSQLSADLTYPLQGVMVSSQRRVILFSTPYDNQKLYIQIFNSSSIPRATNEDDRKNNTSEKLVVEKQDAVHNVHLDNLHAVDSRPLYDEGDSLDTWNPSYRRSLSTPCRASEPWGTNPPTKIASHEAFGPMPLSFNSLLLSSLLQFGRTGVALHWDRTALGLATTSTENNFMTRVPHSMRRLSSPGSTKIVPNSAAFESEVATSGKSPKLNESATITNVYVPLDAEVWLVKNPEIGGIKVLVAKHNPVKDGDAMAALGEKLELNGSSGAAVTSFALAEAVLPEKFKTLQLPSRRNSARSSAVSPNLSTISVQQSVIRNDLNCQYIMNFLIYSEDEQPKSSAIRTLPSNGQVSATSHNAEGVLQPAASVPQDVSLVAGLVSSTNCDRHMVAYMNSYYLQIDTLKRKVEIYSLSVTAICLLQIFLVILQLKHCNTQAMAGKISILGIFAQSLLDAVICMTHLLMGAAIPNVFFSSFIWIAVLKLLLFSVFQMRIIINIYQGRYSQEIAAEGWRGFRQRLVNLHLRFYGAVLLILLLAVTFPTIPVTAVICMYSFWLPQIVYSTYSGTKHPFHPMYLIGTALSRLFLPLYFLGCPHSFLTVLAAYFSPTAGGPGTQNHNESNGMTSYTACYVLVMWVSFQIVVIFLQSLYGPRFFVPKQFLPVRYDYRRPIPNNLGSNSSNSTTQQSSSYRNGMSHREPNEEEYEGDVEMGLLEHQQGLECVICYNPIFVWNGSHMITPCDHVFHDECLQQWAAVKLECPVCRASLPALDD